ncbi:hypothetical protein HDU97_002114, partial [Phlyctochytrium planicorne]
MEVDNFCIGEVVRLCPALTWMDLSGCSSIGDIGCFSIAMFLGTSRTTLTNGRKAGPKSLKVSTTFSSSIESAVTSPTSAVSPRRVPTQQLPAGYFGDDFSEQATPLIESLSLTQEPTIPPSVVSIPTATSSSSASNPDSSWPPNMMLKIAGMHVPKSSSSSAGGGGLVRSGSVKESMLSSAESKESSGSLEQIRPRASTSTAVPPPATVSFVTPQKYKESPLGNAPALVSRSNPSPQTPRLAYLNLSHCVGVTNEGVLEIAKRCG